ncbi:MAG: SNF2-related protein, partial [bacterium]
MNFLERIPAKISQSTLPVIIMKFDDEVWLKTSFSPDIFNDMRDINTASFHKNNEAAAMVLSEFKNKIDLHTKGLPKGIRNEVREESNRIQKAIKKLNGNVWKLSEDDLADALKTVAHFHTGIIVDVRDSFASLHSLVHNLAIEKSKAEFKLPNQERKEELNNRIAKLSSAPSSIKLCLENEPCRIYGAGFENNMVKVKAKYNDGVWDKLKKDIGWSYSDGELFTDDPDKIIEGLTYIDANNYEYTAAINVFENLDNFKERQLMFQAKRKREAEKLEKNKQKAQEKIIEKTQNLKYPLDLAVYDSELGDPGIGYIFKSGDSYNVKMKFGDGVYDELKKLGWIYKGNSIMAIGSNNAPNIESIYDGINFINDGLSDYKIELGALLEFQDICDKALEIKKQKEKDLEQSRAVKIDKDFPAPDGLNYMDYQKAGIEYALQRNSVLIADEMGLGKTIQAIGLINADKEINNALVVCPASLKLNWRNECKKWLVRDLSIGVADGKNFPTTDIVIINYDILQKHHDNIRSFTWDLMVTDEFQCLKNQASLRTIEVAGGQNIKPINTKDKLFSYIDRCLLNVKDSQFAGQVEEIKNNVNELKDKTDPKNFNVDPEIIKLREKVGNLLLQQDQNTNQYFDFNKVAKNLKKTPIPAKQKCGLSGTPFENKPKEVWSVLNYFDPNNWNNFFTFAKEYCNATQNEYGWNFDGASNLEKLQRKLRTSMMIRRKKSDVLSELPPKQRQVIELPSDGIKKEINAENKIFDQQQKILAELKARVEIARISENNEEYAKALQKYNDAQRFAFNEISKV